MFWRLLLTYLLLVVTAVGLVGLLVWQRDPALFADLANTVGLAVVLILAVSTVLAYLFARTFATPLVELAEGARRLADGDLGHKIRVAGAREHSALAETFNAMSGRLAATFDLLEHDKEQLRAILSGMVEGVLAIDHDQREVYVPRYYRLAALAQALFPGLVARSAASGRMKKPA